MSSIQTEKQNLSIILSGFPIWIYFLSNILLDKVVGWHCALSFSSKQFKTMKQHVRSLVTEAEIQHDFRPCSSHACLGRFSGLRRGEVKSHSCSQSDYMFGLDFYFHELLGFISKMVSKFCLSNMNKASTEDNFKKQHDLVLYKISNHRICMSVHYPVPVVSNPWPASHMQLRMAVNAAQHKIIN